MKSFNGKISTMTKYLPNLDIIPKNVLLQCHQQHQGNPNQIKMR